MKTTAKMVAHIQKPLLPLAVPIDSLHPDPANARVHGERNIDVIESSLARFGMDQPLVVQKKGRIIRKGNGRWTAAKRLGWTHVAAVIVAESEVEATARAIADNRSSDLAEWDEPVLARLLESLEAEPSIDALVTGFDGAEIDALIAEMAEPSFEPVSEDEQGRLDQRSPIICPDCGKEFVPK